MLDDQHKQKWKELEKTINDIARHDLPLAATRIREANVIRNANLDTFAKEHSLVSSQYFVSQRLD